MKVDFYNIERLHEPLVGELNAAASRVIESGQYLLGSELAQFEQSFAAYCGTDHCVGVGNGLDALHLSLLALDIGRGDKVLIPANVFIAVALAVGRTGATPVLVDACAHSRNIDPDHLESALVPGVKAILVVHQYGEMAEMDEINAFARKHELFVVEDASQAHGARVNGRVAGSLGNVGCFSFYPSKNLGALGDGGAVVTSDGSLAQRIRILRNYGMQSKNEPVEAGLNSRLDDLQAACLQVKLPYLDEWNRHRREIAGHYLNQLVETPGLSLPAPHLDGSAAWHLFVVCHPRRDALREQLAFHGIETAIHYPYALHRTPISCSAETGRSGLVISETLASTCLSLPLAPYLHPAEVEHIASEVRAAAHDLS